MTSFSYSLLWKTSTFFILLTAAVLVTRANECESNRIWLAVLNIWKINIDAAINKFKNLEHVDISLPTIISGAYGNNVGNVHKLLRFINKLPQCKHRYISLELLFNNIQSNGHLKKPQTFQFAYQLKKILDETPNCLKGTDDANLKEKLADLKEKIPEGIRTIIWEKSGLCLKNRNSNEYLYAADCCKYDQDRRRLFTWMPGGTVGSQGEFTFEPINDAAAFRIKSDHVQEYMYVATCCEYDKDRRNVFTWIDADTNLGIKSEWTLEPADDPNSFRIKNNHHGQYLYAAICCNYDNDRRSVFTWVHNDDIGYQREWEITYYCT